MSTKPPSSNPRSHPGLVVATLGCLDPRRWMGALLAIAGFLISIIAPLLPISLLKRFFQSASDVQSSPRARPDRRRPFPTPVQAPIVIAATGRHANHARPRTADNPPPSPHVKFAFNPHPRSLSTSSLVSSPSNPNFILTPTYESPSDVGGLPPSLPSPAATPTQSPLHPLTSLPHPSHVYSHPPAASSLDSLDLASESSHSLSPGQTARRPFRIVVPRIGFGTRRKSTADLKSPFELETPLSGQSTAVPPLPVESDTPSKADALEDADEWRGTKAFAVKRSNTIATPVISAPEPSPPVGTRRKLTRFCPKQGKEDGSLPIPPPQPTTPTTPTISTGTPAVPPVPSLPSPATLDRMIASLPPSASSSSNRFSGLSVEGLIPLTPTTTPPARPARTDPYKAYGVPVPGSEQARAFLKAEKERIRAERERREQERREQERREQERREREKAATQEETSTPSAEAKAAEAAKPSTKRPLPPRSSRPGGSLKPCIKRLSATDKPSDAHQEVDPGGEASVENEKSGITHSISEFGVIQPATDSTPPLEQPQSPPVRRSWGFTRRSSDSGAEKEEKRRQKEKEKEKRSRSKKAEKDKDNAHGSKKRPKTGDGLKKSKGFLTKDRSSKSKERGYSSDTGVPSLTYKLMP